MPEFSSKERAKWAQEIRENAAKLQAKRDRLKEGRIHMNDNQDISRKMGGHQAKTVEGMFK